MFKILAFFLLLAVATCHAKPYSSMKQIGVERLSEGYNDRQLLYSRRLVAKSSEEEEERGAKKRLSVGRQDYFDPKGRLGNKGEGEDETRAPKKRMTIRSSERDETDKAEDKALKRSDEEGSSEKTKGTEA